ncbi:MAG: nucleotidyltransferase domain-containing protein [Phycisphaerae bacterium]
MVAKIPIPTAALVEFARRWRIQELSLFGSILRDDFRPESDVDVLVVLEPDRRPSCEEWLEMNDQLERLFGRDVDLVERNRIANPFRRHEILATRQVVYAA